MTNGDGAALQWVGEGLAVSVKLKSPGMPGVARGLNKKKP